MSQLQLGAPRADDAYVNLALCPFGGIRELTLMPCRAMPTMLSFLLFPSRYPELVTQVQGTGHKLSSGKRKGQL